MPSRSAKLLLVCVLASSWLLAGWPPPRIVRAASTSAFPGTTSGGPDTSYASNDCSDNMAWDGTGSPGNASTSDNQYIAENDGALDSGNNSDELQFSNFGFSIPDGSTIDGVVVELERHTDSGETVNDIHVLITTTAGVQEGDDKSAGAAWATTDPNSYAVSFGGETDDWGATGGLTEAEVEGTGFGVVLCVRSSTANANPKIDALRITVYYTEPVAVPSFTLSNYRWYVDNDATNPTEVWGTPDIAENTALSPLPATNDPPETADELRLRVAITIGTADLPSSSQQFKLQYKAGTDGSCTTGGWTDVGVGGGAGIWRYATSSASDGATVTTVLTGSDVAGHYTKSGPTATNTNGATVGQDIEYDFHIEHNGAADATRYSFRVVENDDTELAAYTNCPTLTTKPSTSNLLKHGNFFSDEVEQGFIWVD